MYYQWERHTSKFLILSSDTIQYLGGAIDRLDKDYPQWGFRPAEHKYIYVRFDCPADLKEHDGFLRKQKWMWESEEARKEWKRNRKNK